MNQDRGIATARSAYPFGQPGWIFLCALLCVVKLSLLFVRAIALRVGFHSRKNFFITTRVLALQDPRKSAGSLAASGLTRSNNLLPRPLLLNTSFHRSPLRMTQRWARKNKPGLEARRTSARAAPVPGACGTTNQG